MKLPIQISFHRLERVDAVEERIRQEAAQLDKYCDRIMSCSAVVDVPHRQHQAGNVYQVRLDIRVPGEEIAIVSEPAQHDPFYESVSVAIRDAFDSAARKLEEYERRKRGDVKHHEVPTHGRVSKLFTDYGFIEMADGGEVYFHANSVLADRFDDLNIGTEVAFTEELGERGLQASTVRILGRHHHIA